MTDKRLGKGSDGLGDKTRLKTSPDAPTELLGSSLDDATQAVSPSSKPGSLDDATQLSSGPKLKPALLDDDATQAIDPSSKRSAVTLARDASAPANHAPRSNVGTSSGVDSPTVLSGEPSDATSKHLSETQALATTLAHTDQVPHQPMTSLDLSQQATLAYSTEYDNNTQLGLGDTLNKRFVLDALLGEGGMGEVYRAKDLRRIETRDNNPYVALKLLRPEFRAHDKFLISLQRESKKVQTLSHPNIVTVYDFDRDGRVAYLSMEYLEGESLDRVVANGRLDKKEAMYMIDRMSRGLAFAHQEGYVHADFKPANIFLTKDNSVKILDFGIAQAVTKEKGAYINIAHREGDPDINALTPNYASMEMLQGEQALPVDDVYSLCCVAYELLTGAHPFIDADGRRVDAQKAEANGMLPVPVEGVPKYYQQALLRGLSFQREARFENAGDLLDALKPKNTKKQLILSLLALIVISVVYIGFDTWNAKKVPSVSSLGAFLSESATMIHEGDEMYSDGDIDMAHRFYTQAWNLGNDTKGVEDSMDTLKRILDNRMNNIARALMTELEENADDEFRLQQIEIALEFIRKGELGTLDERIENVLEAR